jgi:DNA-binding transcriptional MerR regulator
MVSIEVRFLGQHAAEAAQGVYICRSSEVPVTAAVSRPVSAERRLTEQGNVELPHRASGRAVRASLRAHHPPMDRQGRPTGKPNGPQVHSDSPVGPRPPLAADSVCAHLTRCGPSPAVPFRLPAPADRMEGHCMSETPERRKPSRELTRRLHANRWKPIDEWLSLMEWARFDDIEGSSLRDLLLQPDAECHSVTKVQPSIREQFTLLSHPDLRDLIPWHRLTDSQQRMVARLLSNPDAIKNAQAASEAADEVALLHTDEAAKLAKVSPATIRKWRERGHLFPSMLNYQQRPLYVPRLVMEAAQRSERWNPKQVGTRDPDEMLTAEAAASWLGVGPSTIRTWAHRGKMPRAGTDGQRRALYRVSDLAKVAEERGLLDATPKQTPDHGSAVGQ